MSWWQSILALLLFLWGGELWDRSWWRRYDAKHGTAERAPQAPRTRRHRRSEKAAR